MPHAPEWNVTPFAECPNCGRLLSLRLEKCPDCHELIEEGYAFYSALNVAVVTQACSFANKFKYLDLTAVIALVTSAYMYLLREPWLFLLTPLLSVIPLCAILWWFFKFGRFKFPEPDFVAAKRTMRMSFWLWSVMLLVQLIALATLRGQF